MTRTGHELKDIGRTLSWDALASFVRQCGNDSALSRELNTEAHIWSTREKTNGILADIFDMLSQINANLVAIGEGKRAKNAPLYPRPGTEERRKSDTQHFGKGALPADELRKWMMEKGVLQNERDD